MTMAEFRRVEIIEALAGSGKTQELMYRFLQLMQNGVDPKTILATTFSRKAAGEIRDRIIETLAEAVLNPEAMKSLSKHVPELEGAQNGCELLLRQLSASMHRLNIGTIDSFFVKTAQSFSDALEMTPGWSILDELHESEVFSSAVASMTEDPKATKHIAQLLRWSKSGAKVPIGKTLGDLQYEAYVSVRDTEPSAWLWGEQMQTMSNAELSAAIAKLANQKPEDRRQQGDIHKAVEKLHRGDWKSFLTSGMASKVLDGSLTYYGKEIEEDVVESLQLLINHALGVVVNRLLSKNKGTHELMHELNACWVEAKHKSALYSFDDVAYRLSFIGVMQNLIELQFRMDNSIHHMLVDEFQDTSLTQWSVLKPLVDEIHQSDQDRSLFFVGDVKQSLYGFRGGEPALLRTLSERLACSATRQLEKSWRCSSPVLHAVNTIFENVDKSNLLNERSPDSASTWQEDFTHHVSAMPDRQGYAVIQTAGIDSNNKKTQLALCVEKVVEIVADIHKKAPNSEIGILVRSNTKQQIQRIVHALRTNKEHQVLAAEFGGNPLTDSPAVTVVLSALLMADDPGNSVARFHVCSTALGEYLGIKFENAESEYEDVCRSIRRQLSVKGYAEVIGQYAEHLVDSVDKRDRLRLWQLIELAETRARDTGLSNGLRPSEFVRLVKETQVPDPASSLVQVMTVHKSKGLSFDAVVVCDLDQPIWKSPKLMEHHEDPCLPPVCVGMYAGDYLDKTIPEYGIMRKELHQDQVNDALCLLYVAMTRAKHALHMVIPSRNSKHHLKTLDGLLLQVIGEQQMQEPNKIVWIADGSNDQWHADLDDQKQDNSQASIKHFSINPPDEALCYLGQGIAYASPSSLEGGGKIKISDRFKGNTNSGLCWGTVVHNWFEEIEWFEETLPSVESLIESAPFEEAQQLGYKQLRAAALSFIEALSNKKIQGLLAKPQGRVAVFQEQTFALRVARGTQFASVAMKEHTDIQGSIDRLVVFYDDNGKPRRAEVIDWKTDDFDPDELEGKVKYYSPQLAAYSLAVSKLLGLDLEAVTARLVFLKTRDVVEINS